MEYSPCLICGVELTGGNGVLDGREGDQVLCFEQDITVKKEVISDNEDDNCCNDDHSNQPNDNKKCEQVNDAPVEISIKCEEDDSQQIDDPSGCTNEWSEDEKCIFQLFLKWFGVPIKVKGKSARNAVNLEGWNGSSADGDKFPFCTACKIPLVKVLEIQRMVEELEREIKKSVKSIWKKANSCEDVFENKKIYVKDVRYLGVRQRIVTDFKTRYEGQFFEPKKKTLEKSRTSVRMSAAPVSDDTPRHGGETSISEAGPDILLSTSQKTTTSDQCLLVKTNAAFEEPLMTDCDTDFHHDYDDDGANSVGDPADPGIKDETVSKEINELNENEISNGRRRSTRKRKMVNFQEDDPAEDDLATEKPDNSIQSASENKGDDDSDFDPESSTSVPKRKRKRKFKILVDEDYTMDEAEELMSCDDDDDDFVTDYGPEEGKHRLIFDPEKNTVTYDNLVFYQQHAGATKKYKCSKCNQEMNGIRGHYLRFHSDIYACKHCGYRASGRTKLLDHINIIHKGIARKRLTCRICKKPLCSKDHRTIHEWKHKNAEERREALARGGEDVPNFDRKHQCDKCGYAFRTQSGLQDHYKIRHGDQEKDMPHLKEKKCSECGGMYFQLRLHQKLVHGLNVDSLECTEPGCGKKLTTPRALERHVQAVHQKIRPYKCTMCPREFSHKKNLDAHMDLHLGIRPWQCDQCPMAFSRKNHLEKHSRVYHTEGRVPKRKPFARGPTMLARDMRKEQLISEGKYLPPSALATWAAGREPTSHFPVVNNSSTDNGNNCGT